MEVSIERAVISGIISHVLTHKREVSGLLLGPRQTDRKIVVSDFVVYKEVGREDQIEIPPSFLATTRQDVEKKKKYIIGWYHSHPQRNAFISRTDERTQRTLQQFNSNFISLNVAFREENGRKSKTVTEIICYNLKSDGNPEFFPIQIVENFSSKMLLGEMKESIEKAKTTMNDLKAAMNSDELRTEFIPPILKFNTIVDGLILKVSDEIERIQYEDLQDAEEKIKEVSEENERVTQDYNQLREKFENLKIAASREIKKKEDQKKEVEQKLVKELESVRNEFIKSKRENENLKDEKRRVEDNRRDLLIRVSKLESENSELRKKIKDLEEENSIRLLVGEEKNNLDSRESGKYRDDPGEGKRGINKAWGDTH